MVLDESEQIDEIVNGHQELALLVRAVQELPDRCRQVFTLRKVYGYSQKEIASAAADLREHRRAAPDEGRAAMRAGAVRPARRGTPRRRSSTGCGAA